jgi:hypothetical protein
MNNDGCINILLFHFSAVIRLPYHPFEKKTNRISSSKGKASGAGELTGHNEIGVTPLSDAH